MQGLVIIGAMALVGLGLGGGTAFLLSKGGEEEPEEAYPAPTKVAEEAEGEAVPPPPMRGAEEPEDMGASSFLKMDTQFVVPVLMGGEVDSLITMTLTLELPPEAGADALALQPKLRDALLRVMLDHANAGGFDGRFTEGGRLLDLRDALSEAAGGVLGTTVRDVLVLDLLRIDA